jgi:hypothetical protein
MPLYRNTIAFVLQHIREHGLQEGDRLPTETELSASAGVSIVTVRRALAELAAEGIIRREQGRGTFLARPRVRAETTRLGSLRNGLGLDARSSLETRILDVRTRPAGREEAQERALTPGATVWELNELAPSLRAGEDDGIRKLMELHRTIGKYCDDYRHSRFEEGSEHFFAYCFEHVTGRTLMHGELVSLGVLVMSSLQGNRPELAREIVTRAGVRHRPDELGYSMEEVERTLLALRDFVRREKLWHSVASDLVVGERELEIARKSVDF